MFYNLYYCFHSNCFEKKTTEEDEEYILEIDIHGLNKNTILDIQSYLLQQNNPIINYYTSKIISILNHYVETMTADDLLEISYFHFDNLNNRLLEITNHVGYEKRKINKSEPGHISYLCKLNKFYF